MTSTQVIWLDQNVPRKLAPWIASSFGVRCVGLVDVGLHLCGDAAIAHRAVLDGAIVMTKDAGFLPPGSSARPQILLLQVGNIGNRALQQILASELGPALAALRSGQAVAVIQHMGGAT